MTVFTFPTGQSVMTYLFGDISYGTRRAGMFDISPECQKAEALMTVCTYMYLVFNKKQHYGGM